MYNIGVQLKKFHLAFINKLCVDKTMNSYRFYEAKA